MSQNLVIQASYLDVHSKEFITLRNTLGLPGLPFCWLPLPLQQRWRDVTPDRPPLPLPLDNKPLFFFFFFFPFPEPHEVPNSCPHTSSIQERGLSVHLRHLQHMSAFSWEQRKPMPRKQRKPGHETNSSWVLGKEAAGFCTPCHPLSRYSAFGPSPKVLLGRGRPSHQQKQALSATEARHGWTTELPLNFFINLLPFCGGCAAWCCR